MDNENPLMEQLQIKEEKLILMGIHDRMKEIGLTEEQFDKLAESFSPEAQEGFRKNQDVGRALRENFKTFSDEEMRAHGNEQVSLMQKEIQAQKRDAPQSERGNTKIPIFPKKKTHKTLHSKLISISGLWFPAGVSSPRKLLHSVTPHTRGEGCVDRVARPCTMISRRPSEAAKSGSMTRVMGHEPPAVGTRYIASVGLHEAIVELRRDGWHRGIFNDEKRNWEVPPSWVESAQHGREYCENHLQNLQERALKLDWKQVGGLHQGKDRDEVAKPSKTTA